MPIIKNNSKGNIPPSVDGKKVTIVAKVVPKSIENARSVADARNEFKEEELRVLKLTGLPLSIEHNDKWFRVGKITNSWIGKDGSKYIKAVLYNSFSGLFAAKGIYTRYFDVSLKHYNYFWWMPDGTGVSVKKPVEVSLCQKGKRNGSIIVQKTVPRRDANEPIDVEDEDRDPADEVSEFLSPTVPHILYKIDKESDYEGQGGGAGAKNYYRKIKVDADKLPMDVREAIKAYYKSTAKAKGDGTEIPEGSLTYVVSTHSSEEMAPTSSSGPVSSSGGSPINRWEEGYRLPKPTTTNSKELYDKLLDIIHINNGEQDPTKIEYSPTQIIPALETSKITRKDRGFSNTSSSFVTRTLGNSHVTRMSAASSDIQEGEAIPPITNSDDGMVYNTTNSEKNAGPTEEIELGTENMETDHRLNNSPMQGGQGNSHPTLGITGMAENEITLDSPSDKEQKAGIIANVLTDPLIMSENQITALPGSVTKLMSAASENNPTTHATEYVIHHHPQHQQQYNDNEIIPQQQQQRQQSNPRPNPPVNNYNNSKALVVPSQQNHSNYSRPSYNNNNNNSNIKGNALGKFDADEYAIIKSKIDDIAQVVASMNPHANAGLFNSPQQRFQQNQTSRTMNNPNNNTKIPTTTHSTQVQGGGALVIAPRKPTNSLQMSGQGYKTMNPAANTVTTTTTTNNGNTRRYPTPPSDNTRRVSFNVQEDEDMVDTDQDPQNDEYAEFLSFQEFKRLKSEGGFANRYDNYNGDENAHHPNHYQQSQSQYQQSHQQRQQQQHQQQQNQHQHQHQQSHPLPNNSMNESGGYENGDSNYPGIIGHTLQLSKELLNRQQPISQPHPTKSLAPPLHPHPGHQFHNAPRRAIDYTPPQTQVGVTEASAKNKQHEFELVNSIVSKHGLSALCDAHTTYKDLKVMFSKTQGYIEGNSGVGFRNITACSANSADSTQDEQFVPSTDSNGYQMFSDGPFINETSGSDIAIVSPSASERYPGLQDYCPSLAAAISDKVSTGGLGYREHMENVRMGFDKMFEAGAYSDASVGKGDRLYNREVYESYKQNNYADNIHTCNGKVVKVKEIKLTA